MSSRSIQFGLYAKTNISIAAVTIFRIQDGNGIDLVTFKPARTAYSFLFSSPFLKNNTTYSIYTGGTCTGALKDGLFTGGVYSGGKLKKTFTTSGSVTNLTF